MSYDRQLTGRLKPGQDKVSVEYTGRHLVELYRQRNYNKPYRTFETHPHTITGNATNNRFLYIGRPKDKVKQPYYKITYRIPMAADPSTENLADDKIKEDQALILEKNKTIKTQEVKLHWAEKSRDVAQKEMLRLAEKIASFSKTLKKVNEECELKDDKIIELTQERLCLINEVATYKAKAAEAEQNLVYANNSKLRAVQAGFRLLEQAAELAKNTLIVPVDKIKNLNASLNAANDRARVYKDCLLYTSPSPRDGLLSRMPSSA